MYLISPAHPAQVEWIGAGLTGLEIETWLYRFANVIIHIWVLKIPYCRLFCNSFLSRWTMRFMTVTSICHPLWLGRVHIYAFFLTASPILAVLIMNISPLTRTSPYLFGCRLTFAVILGLRFNIRKYLFMTSKISPLPLFVTPLTRTSPHLRLLFDCKPYSCGLLRLW